MAQTDACNVQDLHSSKFSDRALPGQDGVRWLLGTEQNVAVAARLSDTVGKAARFLALSQGNGMVFPCSFPDWQVPSQPAHTHDLGSVKLLIFTDPTLRPEPKFFSWPEMQLASGPKPTGGSVSIYGSVRALVDQGDRLGNVLKAADIAPNELSSKQHRTASCWFDLAELRTGTDPVADIDYNGDLLLVWRSGTSFARLRVAPAGESGWHVCDYELKVVAHSAEYPKATVERPDAAFTKMSARILKAVR